MAIDLNRLERVKSASCKGGLCSHVWDIECYRVLESEVWNIDDKLVKTVIFKHENIADRLYSIIFDANTEEPHSKYGVDSCHCLVYRRLPEHNNIYEFINDVEALTNLSGLATIRYIR